MRLIMTHTFVGCAEAKKYCRRDHVYGVHMRLIAYGRRKRGPYDTF